MTAYTIEGGAAGKARLDVLSKVMGPATMFLLARAGVAQGARCVDVGCGGGNVSLQLARLVGPSGQVLGIDFDAEVIALARQDARAEELTNVSFHVGDAASVPGGPYDVAYARFLLSHVGGQAPAVLQAMAASLAPGGLLIVEDTDCTANFSYPSCSAYLCFMDLYRTAVRKRGGDPDIGPSLPTLLRQVGVQDVTLHVSQPAGLTGEVKQLSLLTLERITGSLLEERLATPAELARLESELRAFAHDPTTVMSTPRIIQAWGRRPIAYPERNGHDARTIVASR